MFALSELGVLEYYDSLVPGEEESIKILADVNIVITSFTKITRDILAISPSLNCIISTTVGTELIDLIAAKEYGIKVINCPTQSTDAVASLTIAFILALSRRLTEANYSIKDGEWNPIKFRGIELRNKILGVIGYGKIGRKVATIAQALGMKVLWVNSKSAYSSIEKLISESDFISLHLPLNDSTIDFLDERRLKMIRSTSYVINVGRGALINQDALYKCLKSSKLAGAALDVFVNEPLNNQTSEDILKLVSLPNVVATPHLGFNTNETFERMGDELVLNIKCFIEGKIINEVR
jgi:phosphoglycerate dehydrogenase-like enzyme